MDIGPRADVRSTRPRAGFFFSPAFHPPHPERRMNAPAPRQTWPCLRQEGKGASQKLVLDVSVSPNAKKTALVGWHDGALRIRLAAPPVDGAANEALRKWLAAELDVPQSSIELIRGATSRRKQWALQVSPDTVTAWLNRQPALQEGQPGP